MNNLKKLFCVAAPITCLSSLGGCVGPVPMTAFISPARAPAAGPDGLPCAFHGEETVIMENKKGLFGFRFLNDSNNYVTIHAQIRLPDGAIVYNTAYDKSDPYVSSNTSVNKIQYPVNVSVYSNSDLDQGKLPSPSKLAEAVPYIDAEAAFFSKGHMAQCGESLRFMMPGNNEYYPAAQWGWTEYYNAWKVDRAIDRWQWRQWLNYYHDRYDRDHHDNNRHDNNRHDNDGHDNNNHDKRRQNFPPRNLGYSNPRYSSLRHLTS